MLPGFADEWCEADAECGVFVANERRRVAVDVRRAHLHPDRRRRVDAAKCLAENAGGLDTGAEDFVLMVGGLDAVDAAAGEIDQAVGGCKFFGPGAKGAGIPGHVAPRAVDLGRGTGEDDDGSTAFCQMMGERDAEETAAAGDDDLFVVKEIGHVGLRRMGCYEENRICGMEINRSIVDGYACQAEDDLRPNPV